MMQGNAFAHHLNTLKFNSITAIEQLLLDIYWLRNNPMVEDINFIYICIESNGNLCLCLCLCLCLY